MERLGKLFEIKDSDIEGKGVFSKVNLRPNQTIGVALEFQNENELSINSMDKIGVAYLDGVKKNFIITGDFGRYINHAWSPNDNAELRKRGKRIFVVAKKYIPRGKEILVNYDNNPPYLKPSSSHYQ